MNELLNIGFLLGIALSLVAGGDLLLRPNQRQRVQERMENWNTALKSFRPKQWLSKQPQSRFIIVTMLMIIVVEGSGWWTTLKSLNQLNDLPMPSIIGSAAPIFFVVFVLFILYMFARTVSYLTYWWLDDEATFSKTVMTLLGLGVIGALWEFIIVPVNFTFPQAQSFGQLQLVAILAILAVTIYSIVGLILLAFLIIPATVILGHIILKFLIGLMIRIVEYEGGAWSAIIIILTVILGLLSQFLA